MEMKNRVRRCGHKIFQLPAIELNLTFCVIVTEKKVSVRGHVRDLINFLEPRNVEGIVKKDNVSEKSQNLCSYQWFLVTGTSRTDVLTVQGPMGLIISFTSYQAISSRRKEKGSHAQTWLGAGLLFLPPRQAEEQWTMSNYLRKYLKGYKMKGWGWTGDD